jgi:hypothetical protein
MLNINEGLRLLFCLYYSEWHVVRLGFYNQVSTIRFLQPGFYHQDGFYDLSDKVIIHIALSFLMIAFLSSVKYQCQRFSLIYRRYGANPALYKVFYTRQDSSRFFFSWPFISINKLF